MKKWLGIVLCTLLMLSLFALTGCGSTGAGPDSENNAAVDQAVARTGTLDGTLLANGKLEALYSADVVPKISGRIAEIPVDIGSEVKEGDLLVSLDAAEQAAMVDLYAAQLDKAKNSDLPTLKNQAERTLADTEATFHVEEANYQRNKQLYEASAISAQQYEESEKKYLQAKADYEAARNNLSILEQATIPQTIRQFEAQLDKARADYANSQIKSPISGTVTARYGNPGELASPTKPLLSIVNLDRVVVRANVNEGQINAISTGMELRVRIGAVENQVFTGTVTNVALAPEPSTRAYPIKIQLENPGYQLKPGMFAEVFQTSNQQEGIVIPVKALLQIDDKHFVWVIHDGQVERREVSVGEADSKDIIIQSGLTEGERVAVSQIDVLKDGQTVSVRN